MDLFRPDYLARVYGERKRSFVGQHFWARGGCEKFGLTGPCQGRPSFPCCFYAQRVFLVRPAWAHSCGCKSRRKLITANEVKRNCMRVTECREEAWSINREPMDKNRIEGVAGQGERARNREALVIPAPTPRLTSHRAGRTPGIRPRRGSSKSCSVTLTQTGAPRRPSAGHQRRCGTPPRRGQTRSLPRPTRKPTLHTADLCR